MDLLEYAIAANDDDAAIASWISTRRKTGYKKKKNLAIFRLFNLTDDRYLFYFRFNKDDIVRIQRCLGLPPYMRTKNKVLFSSLEGLLILQRRIAYPNRLEELSPMFKRRRDDLSRIFNTMLYYIIEKLGTLITSVDLFWLSEQYLVSYARSISEKGSPLTHCWGFIDGTVREICRPTINQKVVYNGHKRKHALKFQSIVTPNGMIANLYGPVAGSRHDCYLLSQSKILDRIDFKTTAGESFYIYGDTAYALRPQLQCGFKRSRHTTPARSEYNKIMSSMRECVEWSFGKISTMFAFVDFKRNLKLYMQPVGMYYQLGALLSNCHTCIYGNQTASYFDIKPPTLEQYLANKEIP